MSDLNFDLRDDRRNFSWRRHHQLRNWRERFSGARESLLEVADALRQRLELRLQLRVAGFEPFEFDPI